MKQVKGMWSQCQCGAVWMQGGSKTDANFKNSLEIKPVVKPNKEHKQTNKNGDKL